MTLVYCTLEIEGYKGKISADGTDGALFNL